MRKRATFLDLAFDTWSMAEVEQWLAARTSNCSFGYVVTPNVDHMVRLARAGRDERDAYTEADLCLCDSRVLGRLAAMAGTELSVVPGSDLVARLFENVVDEGDHICLIGGNAQDAAALQRLFPQYTILHHEPPMGLRGNRRARAAATAFAERAGARFILLAVGSPQQEMLAQELARGGRMRGTALCIGASVDFIVGTQSRAPLFIQRAGMEWLWRLLKQPRRMARRYLVNGPVIFPLALRWWWTARERG